MKLTEAIMGTAISIEILDSPTEEIFNRVFDYFKYVDEKFSTYKETSEISKINRAELKLEDASQDMQLIFKLSELTKKQSKNYFDIHKPDGSIDPSGLVKGWSIHEASKILDSADHKDYCIEAGGDVQVRKPYDSSEPWKIGIRNPFNLSEIVKVVHVKNEGVATSGTYERGQHIYNPFNPEQKLEDVASITVIGPNIYEADRFATSAFAMGLDGINFIEGLQGFEGYMIDSKGIATFTSGFDKYLK